VSIAQNPAAIFQDAHSVNLGYGAEYNIEGYYITSKFEKIKEGDKGTKQVKRKLSFDQDLIATTNPQIINDHQLLVNKKQLKNNVIETTICYIFPSDYGMSKLLIFNTNIDRNLELENTFTKYFIGDSIPEYVENSTRIDSIDFVGRKIKLGPACNWKGPHNVQCPYSGQMNWAVFKNKSTAQQYLNTQIKKNSNRWLTKIVSDEKINIIFEDVETTAIRMIVQISVPKAALEGSNKLIVYYVSEKIRGKYVSCILSHYTNDKSVNGTSPLINEVLQLIDKE
tara:strand:+ start:154 stop:999 length:846 start_codon:yes stop_codon:yes gene_type:complete